MKLMVKRPFPPLFGDLNTLLDQFERVDGSAWSSAERAFRWDVDQERVLIVAELPGIDPAALDITIDERQIVTIKGERADSTPAAEVTYLRRERRFGSFARSIALPYRVNADAVVATYENGILKLTLPRAEADKPRQISVKAN